jgi:tetratricopeptide (TPR) repeat protein
MTLEERRHWATQSEAARDEVKDFLEEAVDWAVARRRQVAFGAGAAVIAALVVGVIFYSIQARRAKAWEDLAAAEMEAYSATHDKAHALTQQIAASAVGAGTEAMADILEGDLQFQEAHFDKALAAYDKAILEATDDLKPMALADKVAALEALGRGPDCSTAARSFVDTYTDNLLAPQVHAAQVRCLLLQGQVEGAKSSLQRMGLLYQPSQYWTGWASARLQPPAAVPAPKKK